MTGAFFFQKSKSGIFVEVFRIICIMKYYCVLNKSLSPSLPICRVALTISGMKQ